jgi:hypothetical protein
MSQRKRGRIWLYILLAFSYVILILIFPVLDPTRHLPSASRCMRVSEQDILEIARAGLHGELDSLDRNYGETAENLASAEMVQFVGWYPRSELGNSVSYDTGGGVYYTVRVNPGCGIELSFSKSLSPPIVGRLIYDKQ